MWFHEIANSRMIRTPNIPFVPSGDKFTRVMTQSKRIKPMDGYDAWAEIAALAQHYGIPTRLLDWSYDMETAIFFAVKDISELQIEQHPDRCFCIWELNVPSLSIINNTVGFVTPSYSDNPNIRAQSGLFSFIRGDHPDVDIRECVRLSIDAIDEAVKNIHAGAGPILRRIDVKYSEVPKIRDSLHLRGRDHDRFFPNLPDIVRSMRIQSGLERPDIEKTNGMDRSVGLFNHPGMVSTILFIHDNPRCTQDDLSGIVPDPGTNVDSLILHNLATVMDGMIELTSKGEEIASHLITIERLMTSADRE